MSPWYPCFAYVHYGGTEPLEDWLWLSFLVWPCLHSWYHNPQRKKPRAQSRRHASSKTYPYYTSCSQRGARASLGKGISPTQHEGGLTTWHGANPFSMTGVNEPQTHLNRLLLRLTSGPLYAGGGGLQQNMSCVIRMMVSIVFHKAQHTDR
jgi:hypothetical protein